MAEGDDPQLLINQKEPVWSQQNDANFYQLKQWFLTALEQQDDRLLNRVTAWQSQVDSVGVYLKGWAGPFASL